MRRKILLTLISNERWSKKMYTYCKMEYRLPYSLRPDMHFPYKFQVGQCYAKFNAENIPTYTYLGSFVQENIDHYDRRHFSVEYEFTEGNGREQDKYRTVPSCTPQEVDEWNRQISVFFQSGRNRFEREQSEALARQRGLEKAKAASQDMFSFLHTELQRLGHTITVEHAPYNHSILNISVTKDAPLPSYARSLHLKFDTHTNILVATSFVDTISLDKTLFPPEEVQRIRDDVERTFQSYYGALRPPQEGNEGGVLVRSARNRNQLSKHTTRKERKSRRNVRRSSVRK